MFPARAAVPVSFANPDYAARRSAGRRRNPRLFGLAWRDGRVEVCKTGVLVNLDGALIGEVASWAVWLVILAVAHGVARLREPRAPRLWYTPHRAGPWYLLRGAALWAGCRLARSPVDADAAFYFDDATRGAAPPTSAAPMFNRGCTDISKQRVADVFEEVFGYALRVEPERSFGAFVEKADRNGVHDGRIVEGPLRPRDGCVYQRLVETTDTDGMVHDLRSPCVDGAPVVVWEKTRPADIRFSIQNSRVRLRDPASVFSAAEIKLIVRFNRRMGLDWGGLDILRDAVDGRIYIVDVNKTDLGPVIALSWADKIRSMNRLSRVLRRMVASSSPADAGL